MSNYADNILDKDGNPIYLEDKHLNDQTSQTTVATTDAVMLKDTNGAYHSIDKASFNEAVRAAMGSILTNFDKGASIARIPGIDSNNDLGSVTAANLASVLGGVKGRSNTWTGSFDDYTEQGTYDIFTGNEMFFLVVFSGARYTIQIRVGYSASDPSFKFRKKYGNDWSEWVTIG